MTKGVPNTKDPTSLLPSLPRDAEILVIRLKSLGDVVLLTPALTALHAWRPDLRLSVLVEPAFAAVLEGNPAVSEVLMMGRFLSTARALRRRRFPVTFNQHGGPSSALLTAATRSPVRVCWAGSQLPFLYNVLASPPSEFFGRDQVHTVEHRMTQFYAAGMPRGQIPPMSVFPSPKGIAAARDALSSHGIPPTQPYAVLHPGAAFFTRRWAIEGYAELARWLRVARGVAPVVILGPGDAEIATPVRAAAGAHAVVLEGLDLRTLIGLIAGTRLFVGHDTGPTHIAVAARRPVVMIFGSSSSVKWRPWNGPHRVVQNDFPCNPCPGDRCYAFAQPQCILSVTFEQVRDACDALLAVPSLS